jgi:hypothetical protein
MSKAVAYTPEFLIFWGRYPKRLFPDKGAWLRPGKQSAMRVWATMAAEDKAHAMYSVSLWFNVRPKYPQNASTWLNQRGYDDWDMPEPEGEHLPEEMTNVVKLVPENKVNINNERNRQVAALKKG